MKTIKKVSVSPLPRNEASVIDSLNSGDDKVVNAPSIHAVNEGLAGKAGTSHNHDDRYYTKTESDARYKLQGDFAVIEGTINLDANTSENLDNNYWIFSGDTISYPAGYTKTNCVVLAFGTIEESFYDNKGYSFGDRSGGNVFSTVMVLGDVPRNIALYTDGIHISVGNYATSAKTYKYKIVLMKVS